FHVTGVQTCALPIWMSGREPWTWIFCERVNGCTDPESTLADSLKCTVFFSFVLITALQTISSQWDFVGANLKRMDARVARVSGSIGRGGVGEASVTR